MNLLLAAVLAAAFAVATRYGMATNTSKLLASASLAGLGFLMWDVAGLLYGAAFGAWSFASWGPVAPKSLGDLATKYTRHAAAAVAMALACALAGQSAAAGLVAFAVWALFATALEGWSARVFWETDEQDAVDRAAHLAKWLAGGAWGLALALVA